MDRLLFAGLWCLADREGRLENRPKRIKMELFPCDEYDVPKGLENLEKSGFIKSYKIEHFSVIQVVSFLLHQVPHGTEKDSELPDINGVLTVNKRKSNGYVTGDTSRITVGDLLSNGVLTVKQLSINALNPESGILNPESGAASPPANVRALFANPTEETNQKKRIQPTPADAFMMHLEWRPSRDAIEILKKSKITEPTIVSFDKGVAEFVSYWLGQDAKRNQAGWDHAFAQRIMTVGFPKDPSERPFVC